MNIAYDSIGFEENGRILKAQGLSGYLKNGPQKEPFYATTISLSMRIAETQHVDYKKVQTALQLLLLFLGQLLLYQLLRRLQLNETVTSAAILYYGFSPGLISCGLDLYSEIATLPFTVLSVLLVSKAWHFLLQGDRKSTTLYALFFALTATVAVFSKAVLIILYPLFLLPFLAVLTSSLAKGKKERAHSALIFLVIFSIIFFPTINAYRSLNEKYNGNYTFTDDRGTPMLYTLAIKRTAPLTKEYLSLALSSVPGQNVCRAFNTKEACYQWLFDGSADLGLRKRSELAQEHIPGQQISQTLLFSGIRQILSNPLQYAFFSFLEALKMFFWESTKIGFVSYPDWLTHIHDNALVKNALRLFMASATLFSILFTGVRVFKNRRRIYLTDGLHEKYQHLFFLFFFLMLFVGLCALVQTATRYSLPVAPLFIAVIAFTADAVFSKNTD